MKHKRRNIVLIGFMGSGKTTLGLKLSYLLRMPVEDTDKLIERQEGRSITQIFADDGESYFRELETELLKMRGTEIRTYPVCGRRHSGQSGEPAPAASVWNSGISASVAGSGLRAAEK